MVNRADKVKQWPWRLLEKNIYTNDKRDLRITPYFLKRWWRSMVHQFNAGPNRCNLTVLWDNMVGFCIRLASSEGNFEGNKIYDEKCFALVITIVILSVPLHENWWGITFHFSWIHIWFGDNTTEKKYIFGGLRCKTSTKNVTQFWKLVCGKISHGERHNILKSGMEL